MIIVRPSQSIFIKLIIEQADLAGDVSPAIFQRSAVIVVGQVCEEKANQLYADGPFPLSTQYSCHPYLAAQRSNATFPALADLWLVGTPRYLMLATKTIYHVRLAPSWSRKSVNATSASKSRTLDARKRK